MREPLRVVGVVHRRDGGVEENLRLAAITHDISTSTAVARIAIDLLPIVNEQSQSPQPECRPPAKACLRHIHDQQSYAIYAQCRSLTTSGDCDIGVRVSKRWIWLVWNVPRLRFL